MQGYLKVIVACGLSIQAAVALQLDPQPTITFRSYVNLDARQAKPTNLDVKIAAVVPTESGQIGINPPAAEPTPANIEGHTKYLTEDNGVTKWIGEDPSNIAVKTTTSKKGDATVVATITKGVSVSKNGAGGLDILLSPAVKEKLEAIAKQVKPCAKRRRSAHNWKRQGSPSCGLADFVEHVGADPDLQGSFAEPLTDQAWHEVDSGYGGSDTASDGGWEGDGGEHVAGEDNGYFADDEEGFFEAAQGGEAESTVETIVFSSAEEAAAIGAALSDADAVANAAVWGGSTVTAGSFLAWVWAHVKDGKAIPNANSIPKESIHKVTKTKTKTQSSTTSTGSCPTGSPPSCGDNCKPTSVKIDKPKVTGLVNWECSQGKSKGCTCDPKTEDRISLFDVDFHQAVLEAMKAIEDEPKEPKIECPVGISSAPSKFFVDQTAKNFCEDVMKDLKSEKTSIAYDIYGNQIPLLKTFKMKGEVPKRSLRKRSPPENADNYKDYKFFLSYEPKNGKCLVDANNLCSGAWDSLVKSNCGNNHGSAGDRMFIDASIDVGCGKFIWHVEKPMESEPAPSPPSLGNRDCHADHSHHDVHDGQQDSWSSNGCRMFANGKTLKAGDKEIYWHPIGMAADYHQNYKISWIDGCKSSVSEQSVELPIESDHSITCGSLMRANYKDCNNKGAGGQIDAGCLRYDFYATDQ